jgi:hypothetical protein
MSLFSPSTQTASVGNGWQQVAGVQPLTVSNKLYITFIGIEYCQFCAVERFALFDALGNFGNWSYYGSQLSISTLPTNNLTTNPSSSALFYKAGEGDWTINFLASSLQYTSNYIDFSPVEVSDNSGNQLQTPTPVQSGYINKYDPGGSVPFTVVGGNFYEIGAGSSLDLNGSPIIFAPNGTGYKPSYIIGEFNIASSAMHSAIQTEANYISALICFDINNAAPVCSNPAITAISSKL